MFTPRKKIPSTRWLQAGLNLRCCIIQDSEPNTLPSELFQPCTVSIDSGLMRSQSLIYHLHLTVMVHEIFLAELLLRYISPVYRMLSNQEKEKINKTVFIVIEQMYTFR